MTKTRPFTVESFVLQLLFSFERAARWKLQKRTCHAHLSSCSRLRSVISRSNLNFDTSQSRASRSPTTSASSRCSLSISAYWRLISWFFSSMMLSTSGSSRAAVDAASPTLPPRTALIPFVYFHQTRPPARALARAFCLPPAYTLVRKYRAQRRSATAVRLCGSSSSTSSPRLIAITREARAADSKAATSPRHETPSTYYGQRHDQRTSL